MCFNQDVAIFSLNSQPLKLVNQFIYLGSNISSIESDVNICIGKAWMSIDRLLTIRKLEFFQDLAMSILLYGCTIWTLMKLLEKKLDGNYTEMLSVVLNKSWEQHFTKQQ